MEKIKNKEKIFYGLGDLSGNILFAAISFYLLYFMVNVGGLNIGLAGIIFIIARVWDAITDYIMGVISDATKSKYGKRRVYMIFGSFTFGLSFIFLWLCPDTSLQAIKFIYYLFAYVLFNTCWTVCYIPYNALSANITNDYNERTSLNAVRIVMANVGILLGAALFGLLADGTESIFYESFGSLKIAYMVSAFIFGFLAFIIMLISGLNVKERFDSSTPNKYGFIKTLKQFFALKEFRNMAAYYLLSLIGFDIIMTIFIFFVNDTLGFGGGTLSMIFIAIPLVCAMAFSWIWVLLSKKLGKVKSYVIAVVLITISLLFCIILPQKEFVPLAIICVLVGIMMGAIQIMPFAMVPDVIEVDEAVNGVRREGAYYGIMQFLYKSASGIAVNLISWILLLFGYKEGAAADFTQPESALIAIRYIFAIIPGVIFLVSIIFAIRTNLSKKRFEELKQTIDNNRKEKN